MNTSILKIATLNDCQNFATTNDLNLVKMPELLQLAQMLGLNFAKNPKRAQLVKFIETIALAPNKKTVVELAKQNPQLFGKQPFKPFVFGAPNFDIETPDMSPAGERLSANNAPEPDEFDQTAFESAIIELCESVNDNYKMNDDQMTPCMDTVIEIATRLRFIHLTDVEHGVQICCDIFTTLQRDIVPALEPDQINLINDVCLDVAAAKFANQQMDMPEPKKPATKRKTGAGRTEPLVSFNDVKIGDIITYLHNDLPYAVIDRTDGTITICADGNPTGRFGQFYTYRMANTMFYLVERPAVPGTYNNDIHTCIYIRGLERLQTGKRKMNKIAA